MRMWADSWATEPRLPLLAAAVGDVEFLPRLNVKGAKDFLSVERTESPLLTGLSAATVP